MFGTLLSVEKLRNTSMLKLNVPVLDVQALARPLLSTLLSLNDKRRLVIAAGAEDMASNEVATRVRMVFFIWFVLPDLVGFKSVLLAAGDEHDCLQIACLACAGCQSRKNS